MERTYRRKNETNPVKAWLIRAVDLRTEIVSLEKQLSQISRQAYALPSPSSVANTRVRVSTQEEARFVSSLEEKDSLERELRDRLAALQEQRDEIVRTINRYTTGTENRILTGRYLEGHTWPVISMDLGYSVRNLSRMEASALAKIVLPPADSLTVRQKARSA